MKTPTNKQLREFILDCFNEDDLETFCFEYFPEVRRGYFGRGMSLNQKVIELIDYCDRQRLRENLLVNLAQEREKPYRETFAPQKKKTIPPPRVYRPQPRNPNQIFVSHASEDATLAHQIAADLQAKGYDIFITPDSIRPGEKWVPAINRGLEESGIFLLLLTPRAVQSSWVRDETNAALSLSNEGEMRLFFLDAEPCRPPVLWRQRQFLPFRGSDYARNVQRLLQALAGKLVVAHSRVEIVTPPPKLPPNSFIHEKTGLEFVRIPAGIFLYGDDKKRTPLEEYWISKTPVTQAVYQRFIDANPKYDVPYRDADWAKPYNWNRKKRTHPPDKANHPVVLVSWYDAVAFCEWAGLQLPTEAQWEKAARGTDGREYPWGKEAPTDELCNFDEKVGGTTPVGRYSPQGDSPYSCVDMSGNVWEWCLNKYKNPNDTSIDRSDDWRVARGGSWSGNRNFARAAYRDDAHPDARGNDLGVRVAAARRSPSH